jgi:hypothetical protein
VLSAVREAINTTFSFRKQFSFPLKISLASVVDPDSIGSLYPDPDPGVQKDEVLDVLF